MITQSKSKHFEKQYGIEYPKKDEQDQKENETL